MHPKILHNARSDILRDEKRAEFWNDSARYQKFAHTEPLRPLRFCGVKEEHTITRTGKVKQGWQVKCFFVKPTGCKLRNPDLWDTHDPHSFCGNCKFVKGRKNDEVYECLGH